MVSSALSYPQSTELYQRHDYSASARARIAQAFSRGEIRTSRTPPAQTMRKIPLGLKIKADIEFVSNMGGELPQGFLDAISAIRQIETHVVNWDSYGGLPLDERAIMPALQLIVEGANRCHLPRVIPLATGGLGLRWVHTNAELEIDVSPDGKVSALLENLETRDTEETEEFSHASKLFGFLTTYCQLAQ